MNNPITKIRDLVEVTTGLGRIGASIAWDRVRTAAGVRRASIITICGRCGIDPSVCLDDEFEPVCGDCAGVRFGDLARHLDTASFHAIMARRETDKARAEIADLADLTRIHDEALAALSVAIQRAEAAEKTLATLREHALRMAKWIDANNDVFHYYSCELCNPGSVLVQEGFACAVHLARVYLQDEALRAAVLAPAEAKR